MEAFRHTMCNNHQGIKVVSIYQPPLTDSIPLQIALKSFMLCVVDGHAYVAAIMQHQMGTGVLRSPLTVNMHQCCMLAQKIIHIMHRNVSNSGSSK